ncbi:hypothetical protein AURDEDRAFT_178649 [Auricularia subglabra TFB-10046 SS5]|uniref:Uncharacterized protein n=1 Tax=Auricularia subglabra (strain TFB-10046 / SS5) TaxID=717982 RepID=J0WKL3_AURST|nr:hypothetical protein AURDEDRAFT_178649 [Auricularia subglabra TFB-10046 SS5]
MFATSRRTEEPRHPGEDLSMMEARGGHFVAQATNVINVSAGFSSTMFSLPPECPIVVLR